jgi:hypothetical protein
MVADYCPILQVLDRHAMLCSRMLYQFATINIKAQFQPLHCLLNAAELICKG